MKLRTLAFSLLWLFFLNSSLTAKQISIAAIVGDDVITTYDLEQRLKIFAASSNIQISEQNQKALLLQIRELLITERLKMQAAKELSLYISEAEVDSAIAEIAKSNNIIPDNFPKYLESQNLSYDSVYERIKSELLWQKLILSKISPQINVSDIEVEEAMKISAENKKRTEIKYDQLTFRFNDSESKRLAEELSEKIYISILNNEFKFSDIRDDKISTREEVNWVDITNLNKTIQGRVMELAVNEVSKPFSTDKEIIILKLLAKRDTQQTESKELEKNIRHQLFMNKLENQVSSFLRDVENSYYIERKQI